MGYSILFLFVEGHDDELFFERVFKHRFMQMYNHVEIIQYAQTKPKKIVQKIRSLQNIPNANYIFLCDFDSSTSIDIRKKKVREKYSHAIDLSKIDVVREEIESWYLAGLAKNNSLNINPFRNTEGLTKEKLNSLQPAKIKSRIDFLMRILQEYSLERAVKANDSLNIFVTKYDLL